MLDFAAVLSLGGVVIWRRDYGERRARLDAVADAIIEDAAASVLAHEGLCIVWRTHSARRAVFCLGQLQASADALALTACCEAFRAAASAHGELFDPGAAACGGRLRREKASARAAHLELMLDEVVQDCAARTLGQKPEHGPSGSIQSEQVSSDASSPGGDAEIALPSLEDRHRDSLDPAAAGPATGFLARLRSLAMQRGAREGDVDAALAALQEHLVAKNVARDVASSLCHAVRDQLTHDGKARADATAIVRAAMRQRLVDLLSPAASTDLLHEAKERRRLRAADATVKAFTLVFVGVNGVGKSTTLAKVASWMLHNGLRVLIAACDTFRSGAVEQLRVHVASLQQASAPAASSASASDRVALFERGYGLDAAGIAREAGAFARQHRYDVVLIDTAGRMQDNEVGAILERALGSNIGIGALTPMQLVHSNLPDRVVFVGEALAGNQAIDQVQGFDRALRSTRRDGHDGRGIDGLLLTKVDAVDERVGAIVSLTAVTRCPVLAVGTGQTYADLRTLRTQTVVDALLRE